MQQSKRVTSERKLSLLAIALACLAVVLLYLTTLQTDVSGSHSEYTLDTGEFQNALALWGTLHFTGYPLYSLLGSPFVQLARWLGASPAAGTSLFSLLWSAGTLFLVALLGLELGGALLYGVAAMLLLAATHSFWTHSVIAEVYSQTLFLSTLSLWLTLRCAEKPARLPWLSATLGFAVGLHRSALLTAPASALFLLLEPRFRQSLTWQGLAKTALAFAATFLVYLYLPLRGMMGAPWLFSQPHTWEGFWGIFYARGVSELMVPERDPAVLLANLCAALAVLQAELTLPGVLAGLAGLILALVGNSKRWHSLLLFLAGSAFVLFVALFPRAVFLPAVLLPTLLVLALGVALLLRLVSAWRESAALASVGVTVLLSTLLMVQNKPLVERYSKEPRGRELIDSVAALPEARPIVAAPWGTDYFALAYGQKVTGEIAQVELTPHEENFEVWTSERLRAFNTVYLPNDLLYVYPVSQWQEQVGGPLIVSSGEWQMVALTRYVEITTEVEGGGAIGDLPFGDGISLDQPEVQVDWEARQVKLTLHWNVEHRATRDYSVFVHLTDKEQVSGPGDIIAQGDQRHPVYGWSPTSSWHPNTIIRDDYRVSWPEGRTPTHVIVGMYYQDPETGAFHNLGTRTIDLNGQITAP